MDEHLDVDPYGEENWDEDFFEDVTEDDLQLPLLPEVRQTGIGGGDESSRGISGCSGHSGCSGVIDPEQEKFRRKAAILRKNYQPKQKYSNKIFKNNTRQK